jgi:hypothetical protein
VLQDLLGGVAVGDIGLSGLVVLAVLMLMTGRLVPKSTLENAREDAKVWRQAHDKQMEINRVQHDTNSELLTLARADHHALTELQALGTRLVQEGRN